MIRTFQYRGDSYMRHVYPSAIQKPVYVTSPTTPTGVMSETQKQHVERVLQHFTMTEKCEEIHVFIRDL